MARQPYTVAVAAIKQLAEEHPAHSAAILDLLNGKVPTEAYHSRVMHVLEQVCPVWSPDGRLDHEWLNQNKQRLGWLERAFELAEPKP